MIRWSRLDEDAVKTDEGYMTRNFQFYKFVGVTASGRRLTSCE